MFYYFGYINSDNRKTTNDFEKEIKQKAKDLNLSAENTKIIENFFEEFYSYNFTFEYIFSYLDDTKDYFSVEEIFPKSVHPALDLLLGKENREKFLEFVEFLPNISYNSSYLRKFVTSKNYKNYFYKIGKAFEAFVFLNFLKVDVLKILKGEIFSGKEKVTISYEPILIEIERGNVEVINLLKEMMTSETNFAILTDDIFKAIFCSKNGELLELMGKLLLAAKLQEGLRQSIAERMDEGLFENFKYIFKICQENNLFRFSSMKRAIWTWIGVGEYYAGEDRLTKKIVENIGKILDDEKFADELLKSEDNIEVLLGIWKKAIEGEEILAQEIEKILEKGTKHLDLLASYFLNYLEDKKVPKQIAKKIFRKYANSEEIGKDELEILACYKKYLTFDDIWGIFNNDIGDERYEDARKKLEKLFENSEEIQEFLKYFENIVASMKKTEIRFEPCIFPWNTERIERGDLSTNIILFSDILDDENIFSKNLVKYFDYSYYRAKILSRYLYNPKTKEEKKLVLKSLGKAETTEEAFEIIFENNLVSEYKNEIEKNLSLKTAEVRINSIKLLFSLEETEFFEVVKNLLEAKSEQKILGALDLLLKAKNEGKNIPKNILEIVKNLKTENSEIENYKEQILGKKLEEKIFFDADYKPEINYSVKRKFEPKAIFEILDKDLQKDKKVVSILKKLDELIEKHQNFEYKTAYGEETILGNGYIWISYDKELKDIDKHPLPEVWKNFYNEEIADYKLLFALKLILCNCSEDFFNSWYIKENIELKNYFTDLSEQIIGYDLQAIYNILKKQNFKFWVQITRIIKNLEEYFRDEDYRFEAGISLVSYAYENFGEKLTKTYKGYRGDEEENVLSQVSPLWFIYNGLSFYQTKQDFEKYFSLVYEYDLPIFSSQDLALAVIYGFVKIDYFYQKLLEKDNKFFIDFSNLYFYENYYNDFGEKYYEEIKTFTKENFGVLVDYIIKTELKRGEEETEVSEFISKIREVRGLDYFSQILKALGKIKLDRNSWCWGANSKKWNLSHLIKKSIPNPEDTIEEFTKVMKIIKVTDQRLVEIALYSPKWIPFIEKYLGWKGLSSACYYFHAHISDVSEKEEATFAKYSPISIEDFADGAFDIEWFSSAYSDLGEEKFMMLYEAAKYVSDGAKHSRARKFADAVLGKLDISELEKNISEKRNQDSVKAYGLIPFADKKKDLITRYNFLQKFLKESKNFGAQRRASEAKAVQISLENLARNVGFSDVTRLICFVETDLLDQMQSYFKPKNIGEIDVFIEVVNGKSEIIYQKGEKRIKSLPAKYKKDEYVLEIKEIHKKLKEQYSRSKKMFEKSMEDGVEFFGYEIKNLMEKNIIVSPILKDLVLKVGDFLGFYQNGKIVSVTGKSYNLKDNDTVKIAHCLDLFKSGDWALYQKYLFENEIKQAFKQIFRELYTKTDDEMDKFHSMRYSGYQIQASKTVGTLKTRNWYVDEYTGLQKVYHKENIIAKIYSQADWFSPAEIEAPSIDYVVFYDRKTFEEIKIEKIPDLIFSEVMRDVDLAVSVAYVGGVDPETSSSTIEMRKAIFTFNLELFGLKNVTFSEKHAIIEGKMGEYTVHLGSGVIHQKAGSAISVLPVHSAHRGKIFLPFIDEDPKTSEIMTKILFFAEDTKIKDPAILSQIQKV